MHRMAGLCFSACVLCGSSAAVAQQHYAFFVYPNGNIFDGSAPVLVELWIQFDSQFGALAAWNGHVEGDPFGEWSNLTEYVYGLNLQAVGMSLGTPGTGSVNNILLGQFNAQFGGTVNTSNPIRLWSGEWSTQMLMPRVALLSIDTVNFSVYQPSLINSKGETSNIDDVNGGILVVPAPAAAGLLGAFALFASSRRRR